MAIYRLTATKVAHAKPGKHEDGGGLRLVVSNKYSKRWIYRYTSPSGKRREFGLGSLKVVSITEARQKAQECRLQVAAGIDPIDSKKTSERLIPTFNSCAARYIRSHRKEWKNYKHGLQWTSSLRKYAIPTLGDLPVNQITTNDIMSTLKPAWNTKTVTAKRVQGRIENILDYASAHDYREPSNPARWRGHLDKLLPSPTKVKKVRHQPAMPYIEVPGFLAEIRKRDGNASRALELLILTATRTSEVLKATWDEFDIENRTWTIPAERTKTGKEHRVPLADRAVRLLESIPRLADSSYVFHGRSYGEPLSGMAMINIMRKMGYGANGERGHCVPHGFRSSFRDWAGETTNHPGDVVEMALAHTIENKVEAAYRRGDLFSKRKELMEHWGGFASKASQMKF